MFDSTQRTLTGDDYYRRDYEREQDRARLADLLRFRELTEAELLAGKPKAAPVEDDLKFD